VQRNIAALMLVLMIVSNLFLAIKLINKAQTTILIPSEVTDSYRFNGGGVSESYLIDRASEVAKTIFNLTPQNLDIAGETVLKMTYPESYSQIKKQLLELADLVKQRRITTVFFPTSIKANSKDLSALVEGQFNTYLGKVSTSERKFFHLKFINTGAKLTLLEFYEVKQNDKQLGGEDEVHNQN
jgi:conjugal transfer pilus assembly protein TraE